MTDQPADHPEQTEAFGLMIALFEDRLDEAGVRRLESLVCESPVIRRMYVRLTHQHCAIVPLIAGMQAETGQLGEAEATEPAGIAAPVTTPIPASRPSWWKVGVISAAAILVATVGLVWMLAEPVVNAKLLAVTDAAWKTDLKPGEPIPDRAITLTAGLAKIRMTDGTTVIVEAPATLRISKPNELELIAGSVTATVPVTAHGFAVRTASARVVDQGTEFGVDVEADHSTYVTVFRGSVQTDDVHAASAVKLPRTNLIAGQAAVVDPKGIAITSVTANQKVFARVEEFDNRVAEASLAAKNRWRTFSYQLRRDPSLVAYYLFDQRGGAIVNDAASGAVLNGTLGGPNGWTTPRAPGRWPGKSAVSISADALNYMDIPSTGDLDFSNGTGTARPFTILTWIKPDPVQPADVSIFTHGKGWQEQYSLGILNGKLRAWVRGAASVPGKDGGYNVEGPAVTGGWHQVVLTFDPVARQLVFYFDGSPASRSAAPPTLVGTGGGSTMLGGRISHLDKIIPGFNGAVDELAVFNRVLPESEVRSLYESEKP